jgi:hypothetical protein
MACRDPVPWFQHHARRSPLDTRSALILIEEQLRAIFDEAHWARIELKRIRMESAPYDKLDETVQRLETLCRTSYFDAWWEVRLMEAKANGKEREWGLTSTDIGPHINAINFWLYHDLVGLDDLIRRVSEDKNAPIHLAVTLRDAAVPMIRAYKNVQDLLQVVKKVVTDAANAEVASPPGSEIRQILTN